MFSFSAGQSKVGNLQTQFESILPKAPPVRQVSPKFFSISGQSKLGSKSVSSVFFLSQEKTNKLRAMNIAMPSGKVYFFMLLLLKDTMFGVNGHLYTYIHWRVTV
jgi:hypothetical protein